MTVRRKKDLAEIDCVVYGREGQSRNVSLVAESLLEEGFRAVFVMRDGFEAWRAAGFTTQTGRH